MFCIDRKIPLVTVSNLPAELLLGKISILNSWYILGLAFVFVWGSRFIWKFALRKYNSASS
ncbi:MAG: hypothetical protein HFH41_10765 [Lachnospiraceae bacterium]|nr:hypothetical protein [Lachnospiraceae bacterium]